MVRSWGAAIPGAKGATDETTMMETSDDSAFNTSTPIKTKPKAKPTKVTPVKRLIPKQLHPSVGRPSASITRKPEDARSRVAGSAASRPSINPISTARKPAAADDRAREEIFSKPSVKHTSRSAPAPAAARNSKQRPEPSIPKNRQERPQASKVVESSAMDSSVDSPIVARGIKRRRQVEHVESSFNSSVQVGIKGRSKPAPGYWADRLTRSPRANVPAAERAKAKSRQPVPSSVESSLDVSVELLKKKTTKTKAKPREPPSSALETSIEPSPRVTKLTAARAAAKLRQPAVESSFNSSVELLKKKPAKTKRREKPAARYWDENDSRLAEPEKNLSNFADSSNMSFQIVSPGKTLNNIKKMKDSNIINSQVTPPTAYFLSVLPNSDKKSEKIERTKKAVKRLNERVLKKGRTTANIQNQGQKIGSKDPKGLKKYIQESDARFSKICQSKSRLESEISDFSDASMSGFMDE